jgi:hypothetical protein
VDALGFEPLKMGQIDDPARLHRITLDHPALFEQETPVRPRLLQLLDQRLLGALVRHRDEIRRSLAADLQMLDLAEIAPQARRRLARGAFHDSEKA